MKVGAGLLVGLGAAALILLIDTLLSAGSRGGLSPFELVELRTYDWRLVHTARPQAAGRDIALVEIDEYSLRNLQANAGRWPWPRIVHSWLLDYLMRGPAKVIAYDVNFAEADTRRGFDFGADTASGAESDQALVDAVKAAGNVILVADATYEAREGQMAPLSESGFTVAAAPGFIERRVVYPPFKTLAAAAAGIGHNLFMLDADGPLRHTVPLVRSGSRAIPSLGLAVAMRVAAIRPSDVRLDDFGARASPPSREASAGHRGAVLKIGDRTQPLAWRRVKSTSGPESFVWALINFRGPALLDDLTRATYPTYSFYDLLYSREQILAGVKPKIDPSVFRDKIVFVGATAAGLYDVFETPFASGKMPGIQVHAAVVDDILSNRFLRAAPDSVRIATVVIAALAIGVAATTLPAWWAAGVTLIGVATFGWAVTRAFAGGSWLNFTQPVAATATALFGGVAYQYFVEGREKRKMKRLFGQYVSKDVYEQLVADPALARLGGHRRDMTVLFSDIRGFTTVTERGEPEEIVGMLNEYFTRMVEIVFHHHGTLDKFVGDMVMALFGAPLDDPEHPDHAVAAALDMLDALNTLNAQWRAEGRPELDIGIGINTGPMIAGNIGSEAIMSYTVVGDAVNLGSRLESLNKEYGTRIIISETTRDRLSRRYRVRPLGDVIVKGKTRPVAIFELVSRL